MEAELERQEGNAILETDSEQEKGGRHIQTLNWVKRSTESLQKVLLMRLQIAELQHNQYTQTVGEDKQGQEADEYEGK